MDIVIIGAGNVASVLGLRIKATGHTVLQVISRHPATAEKLAGQLNCPFSIHTNEIDSRADLYLFAISDTSLYQLNDSFNLGNKVVVHTAGSVSKEVLSGISSNYGVLYPLQSLHIENSGHLLEIPLLIDANNKETYTAIKSLADTLSDNVAAGDDEERMKLHLAAVVVNNFTNHLFSLTAEFCEKEKIDFKKLQPLIEETAYRSRHHHPKDLQTGPAQRNDISTLEKHLRYLQRHPMLRSLYIKLSESIMNQKTYAGK